MKEKMLFSKSRLTCVRANSVGGLRIICERDKEVCVRVYNFNFSIHLDIPFGIDAWKEAQKWVEDAVFIIEQEDIDNHPHKRLLRLEEEKNGSGQ